MKRIALVTGGTGGIGTAICRNLYAQGFKVVAGFSHAGDNTYALQWQAEQKAAQYEFELVHGDVTNFQSCGEMIDNVVTKIGPIDVLVNNAGITRDTTLKKMELKQWEEVLNANLDSVFNVTRHVINSMIERAYGRIINISSINAHKGSFGQTNYSAAKAGMHGFTKALALEVASKGITVNTVSPGYVATDMVKKMKQEVLDKIIAQIPVGRLAEPNEVGKVVAFLAAEEAGYITGADFSINGGLHMY